MLGIERGKEAIQVVITFQFGFPDPAIMKNISTVMFICTVNVHLALEVKKT